MNLIFRRFFNNWAIKLLSLLAAIVLWLWVQSGITSTIAFPTALNVESSNLAPGLVAIPSVKQVHIRVSTQQSVYQGLGAQSFKAFVDLRGMEPSSPEVPIQVISLVPQVQILAVTPTKTLVSIERAVTQEIPVSVQIQGQAGQGFGPDTATASPNKVSVQAAESVAQQLKAATAIVTLNGETDSLTKRVPLVALDSQGLPISSVSFDPPEVDVTVPIVRASSSRVIGVRARLVGKPRAGFYVSSVDVTPATVGVSGPAEQLASIKVLDTADISIEGISDTKNFSAALKFPTGVSPDAKSSGSANVKITISPNLVEREITASYDVINLAGGLTVKSITPGAVKVLLSGPASILNGLSSSSVVLTVDLGFASSGGAYRYEVSRSRFKIPEGVSIVSFSPSALTVEIQ